MNTDRAQIVEELKQVCLPYLNKAAEALRAKYPQFHIHALDCSVGSKTEYQGHSIFLECDRKGSNDPEPNCLCIDVTVCHLDRNPTLCSLDVGWGGDGIAPCGALDCLDEDMPWGDSAITLIQASLPKLHQDLDRCLQAWVEAYLQ